VDTCSEEIPFARIRLLVGGEDMQLVPTRETLDLPEERIDDTVRPTPVNATRNDHRDLQPT